MSVPDRVLETRRPQPGMVRRRYERGDGSRFTTIELPVTVFASLGRTRLQQQLEKWIRGEDARAEAARRRERAYELLREGVKPTAIAHELGISDARVRQYRAELRGIG